MPSGSAPFRGKVKAPPPPPGVFPTAYDPARLGSALVSGESWQDCVFGPDNGYASVKAKNWGGVVGQIMLDPDPVFAKVVKWAQPAYQVEPTWVSTLQRRVTLPTPISRMWFRAVCRLDGNGNPRGFTSYGTGIAGGSTTWKMLFAFPVGTKSRMEFELLNGGDLFLLSGQTGDNVSVESSLPQGSAPVPPIAGSRISISKPSVGIVGDLLLTGEWFELVMNFEPISATEYLQRYFARQLSSGLVWAPRPYPTWKGWKHVVTSGAIAPYNLLHLGGNKSQTNDGPNHQFVRWGPYEVSTAADPYGWARYGL